jgi:hypothetical protein
MMQRPELFGARRGGLSRALWTGLLPYGAWAAVAGASEHVPRITPEMQDVLALFRGSPPWCGVASLIDISSVLAANMRMGQAVGVPLDAALFLPDLVSLLVNAPVCAPATLHEALALSCRAALGSWSAGAVTATAALSLVTSALDAFCVAASSIAASSAHTPPRRPAMVITNSLVAGLIPVSRVAHGQRSQLAWLNRGGRLRGARRVNRARRLRHRPVKGNRRTVRHGRFPWRRSGPGRRGCSPNPHPLLTGEHATAARRPRPRTLTRRARWRERAGPTSRRPPRRRCGGFHRGAVQPRQGSTPPSTRAVRGGHHPAGWRMWRRDGSPLVGQHPRPARAANATTPC